jgi:hypothetical protein
MDANALPELAERRRLAMKRLADLLDGHVGLREVDGQNRSAIIDAFNVLTKAALGSPYCLAGILYCINQVEQEQGVSFDLPLTSHCRTFWNLCRPEIRHQEPQAGDIVIWGYSGTASGHAGFVKQVKEYTLTTIEFNTGPGSDVIREGEGCYEKVRKRTGSSFMKILGYVRISDQIRTVEQ